MNCQSQYQTVQIAVAISIIKETPPHLTPRDFATNLQKVLLAKGCSLHVGKQTSGLDHNSPECLQHQQHNISTDNQRRNEGQDSERQITTHNLPGLRFGKESTQARKISTTGPIGTTFQRSEKLTNSTFEDCLIGNELCNDERWLLCGASVNLQTGSRSSISNDVTRKRTLVKGEKPRENSRQPIQNCGLEETVEPLVTELHDWKGCVRNPPNGKEFLNTQNPKVQNNVNTANGDKEFLNSDTGQHVFPDSTSCHSPSVITTSDIGRRECARDQELTICRWDDDDVTSSSCIAPLCEELLKECGRGRNKSNDDRTNPLISSCNREIEKSNLENQYSLLSKNVSDGSISDHSVMNLCPLKHSNVDKNARGSSFLSMKKEIPPLSQNEGENTTFKNMKVSLKECQESLNTVLKEIEDAMKYAYFGLLPRWINLHFHVKVISSWLHQSEGYARETEAVCVEFISRLLTLLFQFNSGSRMEGTLANTTTIWWMILFEVRGLLMSFCTNHILCFPSGNQLIKALLFASQRASYSISDDDASASDHISEIAYTLAEVLKRLISYANTLPQAGLQPLGFASNDSKRLNSPIEVALLALNPNNDISEPLKCTHYDYGLSLLSTEDRNLSSKERRSPTKLEVSMKTASSTHLWKLRIHNALQSLASEDFVNLDQSYDGLPQQSASSNFPSSYPNSPPSSRLIPLSSFCDPVSENTRQRYNLQNAHDVKSTLMYWRSILIRECLPNVENAFPMLCLQIREIIQIIDQ